MSLTNCTLSLLGIKDKNIVLTDEITEMKKNGVLYKVLHGKLSYIPSSCSKCGCSNVDHRIIKYGTKTTYVRLLPCNGQPTILQLKKQRFFCKECKETFTATTTIVLPYCNIGTHIKRKILLDSRLKISEKDIARQNGVSDHTVHRMINSCFEQFTPCYHYLPKHLCFDEFQSTRDCKGAMSFVFVDADTSRIIDIVENRQLPFLKRYFSRYSKAARQSVKTICIDMYKPYITLIKEMFPKAKIIIDRFHMVQLVTRAFNKTRISTMKKLPRYQMEYKRLKRYWKIFLKSQEDLDGVHFQRQVHFSKWISQRDLVEQSLNVNGTLMNTYSCYQDLLYAMKKKDFSLFTMKLHDWKKKEISKEMRVAITTLINYEDYIKNAMTYEYTNGVIEGINNYIKVIKRLAFGFRSFYHFRNRILICRSRVTIKKD